MILGESIGTAVQAAGWSLIHFIWQGLLIGLAFRLGCYTLRNTNPRVRYLFGLVCIALLLLIPLMTGLMIYQDLIQRPGKVGAVVQAVGSPLFVSGPGSDEWWAVSGSWSKFLLPVVVAIWAAGALWMSLRVVLDWHRMTRLARVAVKPLDHHLQANVSQLKQLFGINRSVRVLESALVHVPTVFGWLKPVILLPTSCLTGLTPAQFEMVIAHELAHLRRFDYLVNLFQVVVETLLFYHPVVRWISTEVRNEREKCCDDLVLAHWGNRVEYIKTLSNLMAIRDLSLNPALSATGGQLLQRVERIAGTKKESNNQPWSPPLLSLLLVATVIIVMTGADTAAYQPRQPEHQQLERTLNQPSEVRYAPVVPVHRISHLKSSLFEDRELTLGHIQSEEKTAVTTQLDSIDDDTEVVGVDKLEVATVRQIDTTGDLTSSLETQTDQPMLQPEESIALVESVQNTVAECSVDEGRSMMDLDDLGVETPEIDIPVEIVQDLHVIDDSKPRLIRWGPPEYPRKARVVGRTGFVKVAFSIDRQGRPVDLEVLESQPRYLFSRAAKDALRDWRFDPESVAESAGRRFTQDFTFELNQSAHHERRCASTATGKCELVQSRLALIDT